MDTTIRVEKETVGELQEVGKLINKEELGGAFKNFSNDTIIRLLILHYKGVPFRRVEK